MSLHRLKDLRNEESQIAGLWQSGGCLIGAQKWDSQTTSIVCVDLISLAIAKGRRDGLPQTTR